MNFIGNKNQKRKRERGENLKFSTTKNPLNVGNVWVYSENTPFYWIDIKRNEKFVGDFFIYLKKDHLRFQQDLGFNRKRIFFGFLGGFYDFREETP